MLNLYYKGNASGLRLIGIKEEYVTVIHASGRVSRCKIQQTPSGRKYFKSESSRFYLDEFLEIVNK